VPDSIQRDVLKLLHAAHAGIVQTKAYVRGYIWWVGIDQHTEQCVTDCLECQMVRNNPPKEPQIWIIPEKPWSRVHADIVGPFQGKTFLV
jgi:hypothetical protein